MNQQKTGFAYLMHLFILETFINRGLGKKFVEYIVNDDTFKDINFWRLDTKDAHELYRKFGFLEFPFPGRTMVRRKAANLSFNSDG